MTFYITDPATAVVNLARAGAWWLAMHEAWNALQEAIGEAKDEASTPQKEAT